MGAAIATFLAFFYIFFVTVFVSQKISNVVWEWRRISILATVAVSLGIAGLLINFDDIWVTFFVRMLLFSILCPLLYIVGFFRNDEIKAMISYIRTARTAINRWAS
jgi:hypothetical protein